MMGQELAPKQEELPGKLSGNFGSFDRSDWWLTTAFAAIGIIVWNQLNILAVAPIVVLWYLLMIRRDGGRVYYDKITSPLASFWKVTFRHGDVWKQGDATVGDKVSKRQARKEQNDDSVIPFVATSVPSDFHGETIGIMHRKRASTDSFVVVGEGSSLASLSLQAQHDGYRQLTDMVKRLVGVQRGYSVGVSFVFRKDPFDSAELETGLENLLHPEVFAPSGLDKPEDQLTDEDLRWLLISHNWQELRDLTQLYGRKVWMAVVVTLRREGILAKAQADRTINQRYVGRLPINKMVKAVVTGLQACGVTEPRPLDRSEIHDFIRGAWDTETIHEYYEEISLNPESRLEDGYTGHWPKRQMKAASGYSVTDGTHSTVLRVKGTHEQVWQGYFRELVGGIQVPFSSFALVGEAVRSNQEVFWLERATALLEGLGAIMGVSVRTLRAEAREERLSKRKRDIFESEFSQSYSILITLHAESEEVLDDYADQVEQWAMGLGMHVARITLATHQYPALWSGTTGINML